MPYIFSSQLVNKMRKIKFLHLFNDVNGKAKKTFFYKLKHFMPNFTFSKRKISVFVCLTGKKLT